MLMEQGENGTRIAADESRFNEVEQFMTVVKSRGFACHLSPSLGVGVLHQRRSRELFEQAGCDIRRRWSLISIIIHRDEIQPSLKSASGMRITADVALVGASAAAERGLARLRDAGVTEFMAVPCGNNVSSSAPITLLVVGAST